MTACPRDTRRPRLQPPRAPRCDLTVSWKLSTMIHWSKYTVQHHSPLQSPDRVQALDLNRVGPDLNRRAVDGTATRWYGYRYSANQQKFTEVSTQSVSNSVKWFAMRKAVHSPARPAYAHAQLSSGQRRRLALGGGCGVCRLLRRDRSAEKWAEAHDKDGSRHSAR